jgi:hypothetical protein
VYRGTWVNGKRNGIGSFSYAASGSFYVGDFHNDARAGFAKCTFGSGGWYIGKFVLDRMHGIGMDQYRDGPVYIGEWYQNTRHGKGVQFGPTSKSEDFITSLTVDRLEYAGEWKNGMKNGTGIVYHLGDFVTETYLNDVRIQDDQNVVYLHPLKAGISWNLFNERFVDCLIVTN